jgi:hypothetical protein
MHPRIDGMDIPAFLNQMPNWTSDGGQAVYSPLITFRAGAPKLLKLMFICQSTAVGDNTDSATIFMDGSMDFENWDINIFDSAVQNFDAAYRIYAPNITSAGLFKAFRLNVICTCMFSAYLKGCKF